MRSLIHLAVTVLGSLGLIWWAMARSLIGSTRLTIGALWGLIGLIEITTGRGEYDRLIGAAQLASAYIVLMPFFPWRRGSSNAKRISRPGTD